MKDNKMHSKFYHQTDLVDFLKNIIIKGINSVEIYEKYIYLLEKKKVSLNPEFYDFIELFVRKFLFRK